MKVKCLSLFSALLWFSQVFTPFPAYARSASGTFGIWRRLYSISFMVAAS